jgi:hypothetical protein
MKNFDIPECGDPCMFYCAGKLYSRNKQELPARNQETDACKDVICLMCERRWKYSIEFGKDKYTVTK